MQSEDMNQNHLDEIGSIDEYDDLARLDEEADLPFADDVDQTLDSAAAVELHGTTTTANDDATQSLHIIDSGAEDDQVRAKSSISDLPITVTAQIGMFSMALSDLENLNEEDLIKVSPDYQNKVSLQVSGAEIGVGDIVSINGDVAIQITRLWS